MSFWTDNNFEPKRAMRFKVSIGYGSQESPVPYFFVKDFAKPTFDITVTPHKVAGREFNFPGSIKWNAVKATFVDDVGNTVLRRIVETIAGSNYTDILGGTDFKAAGQAGSAAVRFISKAKMTTKLSSPLTDQPKINGTAVPMVVEQLDANGLIVESWTMYNPIISKLELDTLDYGKEDLSTYSLTINYDWASFRGRNGGQ